MLVQSVLEARSRVTLEVNIAADRLPSLLETLPCMREPAVASTYAGSDTTTPTGFAVKVAVPRADLPTLIPQIKAKGGTDIIVTKNIVSNENGDVVQESYTTLAGRSEEDGESTFKRHN